VVIRQAINKINNDSHCNRGDGHKKYLAKGLMGVVKNAESSTQIANISEVEEIGYNDNRLTQLKVREYVHFDNLIQGDQKQADYDQDHKTTTQFYLRKFSTHFSQTPEKFASLPVSRL